MEQKSLIVLARNLRQGPLVENTYDPQILS